LGSDQGNEFHFHPAAKETANTRIDDLFVLNQFDGAKHESKTSIGMNRFVFLIESVEIGRLTGGDEALWMGEREIGRLTGNEWSERSTAGNLTIAPKAKT
jgi:hypothetical protein